jgi:glucosamine 6-phosphate synthetase-like amidotransferase/phosphosugar isomerase protein
MEGALKLKEISYIHAEAYPAGELKHGPLALVDADMPVISIAPNDQLLDKLKSNLKEVQARGGELYVFADADSEIRNRKVCTSCVCPSTTANCRQSCTLFRCNCCRITLPGQGNRRRQAT